MSRKFINRYMPVHERVLERTKIPKDKNKCWIWQGPLNNAGYGLIKGDTRLGDSKMVTVHRVMARHKGLQIKFKEVQHTCLNKACVNPDHLVLGNSKTRYERLENKYGKQFMKPKEPYITCAYCDVSTHVVWFSRKHKNCYDFTCMNVE
jgi:hypothetical protein